VKPNRVEKQRKRLGARQRRGQQRHRRRCYEAHRLSPRTAPLRRGGLF
jgi:hypothetical protein